MRRVFDDEQAIAIGYAAQGIHVARTACKMNGQNGLGTRGDASLNFRGVDVHRITLDVGEYGRGARMHYSIGGCRERERRGDYFVAFADSQDFNGEVQRCGTRSYCNGMLGANELSETCLE